MGFDYILSVFTTIVTIVDPIGLIPIFLALHPPKSKQLRLSIIMRAIAVAMGVSLLFLFLGKTLFHYLEIQFEAIYIVGGVLLFRIGLDMIYARPREMDRGEQEKELKESHEDIAIYPLAIPMLAGPGTLATIIMFSSRYSDPLNYVVICLALIVSFLLAAVTMYFSTTLVAVFKKSGLSIMDRVMGIILCSLAVQFIINAFVQIIRSL